MGVFLSVHFGHCGRRKCHSHICIYLLVNRFFAFLNNRTFAVNSFRRINNKIIILFIILFRGSKSYSVGFFALNYFIIIIEGYRLYAEIHGGLCCCVIFGRAYGCYYSVFFITGFSGKNSVHKSIFYRSPFKACIYRFGIAVIIFVSNFQCCLCGDKILYLL